MFRGTTRDAENCPPAEWLAALAAGRAWPWRRRHLAEHLSHCSHCADDYRVLTTARGGLVSALEGQGNAGQDVAAGWLRPGLVAAAALVVVALSVSVLVQTGGPSAASDPGVLFATQFEPGQRKADQDRLFTSDFGESEGEGAQLFRDNFGG
ncbi:MAG TPA: hypothetical protein VKO85_12595 [Wenzhouxiangellaceae bacterium]|nr:hypothetical protein [Wenzhouxiangellaceae bacterium]